MKVMCSDCCNFIEDEYVELHYYDKEIDDVDCKIICKKCADDYFKIYKKVKCHEE